MFFVLTVLTTSLRPVILIHGLGGVSTWGNLTSKVPVCGDLTRIHVWPDRDFAAQNPDCVAYFLEAKYNSVDKTVAHNPEVVIDLPKFGELEGIPAFITMKPFLESKGYVHMKNLFGFSYDWTLYPTGTPNLFKELKENIEKIHADNGEKVVILAHSLGTHVLRRLVTHDMPADWVKEHIDGVIFNAPAFYGCFVPFSYIVTGKFSYLEYTEQVAIASKRMPSLHAMFDNYVAFKDTVIFSNTTEGNVLAPNAKDYFIKKGTFDQTTQNIFAPAEELLKQDPPQPPVRALILYNGGVKTLVGFDGQNLQNEVFGKGDGVCHTGGPEFVCKKWSNTECINWNKDDADKWGHSPMLDRDEAQKKIYDFITAGQNNDDGNNNTLMYVLIAVCVLAVVAIVVLIVLCVVCKRRSG